VDTKGIVARVLTPLAFASVWATIILIVALPYAGGGVLHALAFKRPLPSPPKNIFVTAGETSGTVPASSIVFPTRGVIFGKVEVPELGVSQNLVFGDSNVELKKGVGQFAGSHFPGESSVCLIAGHNNTQFNGLKNAKEGMEIIVSTNYGKYVYKITETHVAVAAEIGEEILSSTVESVILYTCYPFDVPGFKSNRLFVYGECISGPKIDPRA
jgi:sortase A